MYDCRACRSLDCVRPWWIKCWKCDGTGIACRNCNGSGRIDVSDCPRSLNTIDSMFLLPYFYQWWHHQQWPNGKGRMFQPMKLIKAFNILAGWMADRMPKG